MEVHYLQRQQVFNMKMIRNNKGEGVATSAISIVVVFLAIILCIMIYTQAVKTRVDSSEISKKVIEWKSVMQVLEYDVHSATAVDILDGGYTMHLAFSGNNSAIYTVKDGSLYRNNERMCTVGKGTNFGVEGSQVIVNIGTTRGYNIELSLYSTLIHD